MQTQTIQLDRAEARDLYREYKKHIHWSEPIDDEIRRTYQLIAQGRTVIRALESIKTAGLGEDGYPHLAICRADMPGAKVTIRYDGSATMTDGDTWRRSNGAKSRWFDWPAGSFEAPKVYKRLDALARIPIIPIHLRPRRGLANYHVLWEAEWEAVPPKDPFLLRRIGQGDMWLVVAAWDLTEVERAALAARINAA